MTQSGSDDDKHFDLAAWGVPPPPPAEAKRQRFIWLPAAILCFVRFWKSHVLAGVFACSVLAVLSSPFYITATFVLVFTGFEAGTMLLCIVLSLVSGAVVAVSKATEP